MNKKTIFDKHLYKEGMRSLLPFGAIFLGLLCIFTCLYSVFQAFSSANQSVILYEQFTSLSTEFCFLYFFTIVLITPVLTLRIFSFLTTRNGSDFYHAIPHKKQCIYLSYSLAVCSWILLCTVIPASIGYILYSIAGVNAMPLGMFILLILHILVASLLVHSAISIALTITGTMLATIVTTGLILFFPRLFIYGCRLILSATTDNLIFGNGFFFGTRCNMLVQSFINFSSYNSYLFSVKPLIYTLILSLLYILLAIFLFNKRPSELAMKSALSKKFQAGLCLLIGTAFSLIPIALICTTLNYEHSIITFEYIFTLFTIYVLIIIAMGTYELLSTKKVRNLLRIIPRTGILIVINVVIFFGLHCGRNLITSYIPDSSDIKSVSFIFSNPNSGEIFNDSASIDTVFSINNESNYYNTGDYFAAKANTYTTSNETIRTIVADALKSSASTNVVGREYRIGVTLNTGLRQVTRMVRISNKDYETLQKELLSDTAFASIYTDFPNVTKHQLCVIDHISYNNITGDTVSLYETMCKEITEMGIAKYSKLMQGYNGGSIASISFGEKIATQYVTGTIAITKSLPKTYQKYIELVNHNNKDALKNFKQTVDTTKDKSSYKMIEFGIISSSSNSYYESSNTIWLNESIPDVYDVFINSLISIENNPIDFSKKDSVLVMLTLQAHNSHGSSNKDTVKIVQVDKATYKKLTTAITKYDASSVPEENY